MIDRIKKQCDASIAVIAPHDCSTHQSAVGMLIFIFVF